MLSLQKFLKSALFPVLLFSGFTTGASESIPYKIISITGDVLPGDDGPGWMNTFRTPLINELGEIFYGTNLAGEGVTGINNRAIVLHSIDSSITLAREGKTISDLPGLNPRGLGNIYQFNERGEAVIGFPLAGSGVTVDNDAAAVLFDRSGLPEMVYREGSRVPDTPVDVVFDSFLFSHLLSASGEYIVRARMRGPGINSSPTLFDISPDGIYTRMSSDTALNKLIAGGDIFVVNSIEKTVKSFQEQDINPSGAIVLSGLFVEDTDPTQGQHFLMTNRSGNLEVLALEGDAAPFLRSDAEYLSLGLAATNTRGDVGARIAYEVTISGRPHNHTGFVIYGADGSTQVIAKTDQDARIPDESVTFQNVLDGVMNDRGEVAFFAFLQGDQISSDNDEALFLASGGELTMIAREGDIAPGVDDNATFSSFSTINRKNLTLNNSGQVAFITELEEDIFTDRVLYATDQDGELRLILREGMEVDVDKDPLIEDLRTVANIHSDGVTFDYYRSSTNFNDAGQLVVQVSFADDGVFSQAVYLAAVPEPSSIAGFALLGILAYIRRYRH